MNTEHNPDNLTPEQVGEGWRLLRKDEEVIAGDEVWHRPQREWFWTDWRDVPELSTYRRRIEPAATEPTTEQIIASKDAEIATLRAELDAAKADSARVDWQPIETAPKTGSDLRAIEILAWIPDKTDVYDGGDWEVVYWEPYARQWHCFGNPIKTPTHWMPLPKAPAIADAMEQ